MIKIYKNIFGFLKIVFYFWFNKQKKSTENTFINRLKNTFMTITKQVARKQLATDIREFLKKYAKLAAEQDPEEGIRYNSPDAHSLECAAELLEQNKWPDWVNSEWGQGGYGRWSDKVGRAAHDYLLERIKSVK